MQPTEAQVKEFWEWCGLEFYVSDNRVWARTPSGGAVELLVDLNNLFKYAVPKLGRVNLAYEYYMSGMTCRAKAWAKDGTSRESWNETDPALALFWAIWEIVK